MTSSKYFNLEHSYIASDNIYGVAIDTNQSVALHYVLTIDTDQVLSKTHDVTLTSNRWSRY